MWLVASINIPNYFKTLSYHHLKVITSEAIEYDQKEALQQASLAEALIITSQEAVKFFAPVLKHLEPKKTIFCSGPSTLNALKAIYCGEFILPKSYDQEGLAHVILESGLERFFYPKAKITREFLIETLEKNRKSVCSMLCYQTLPIKCDLSGLKGITGHYFGSKSCVEAYFQSGGKLYSDIVIVPGHVTKNTVESFYGKSLKILLLEFSHT